MNKEWSELNKAVQICLKKEASFAEGIETLLKLREMLMDELERFKTGLCREEFNAIPFINADGYHSKTIAYSIWHIFRIEDIVVNSLIKDEGRFSFREIIRRAQARRLSRQATSLRGGKLRIFRKLWIWTRFTAIFTRLRASRTQC